MKLDDYRLKYPTAPVPETMAKTTTDPTTTAKQTTGETVSSVLGNLAQGMIAQNPYIAGAKLGFDVLTTGFSLYQQEKARRAQARAMKSEIARQEAIRDSELADQNNWRRINFALQQEDRQLSREEYDRIKQVEYFNRFLENLVKTANTDEQLRSIFMKRLAV